MWTALQLTLALLLALLISSSSSSEHQETKTCPPAHCADPHFDPTTGCSSCEGSGCPFRGCVKYGAFGPTWRPDNCTICSCSDETGKPVCTKIECSAPADCHGRPLVHKPGRCCPECDYGVARDACGVVPGVERSLYLALGDLGCQQDVLFHRCDKNFFYLEEEKGWFECVVQMSQVSKELSEECQFKTHVSHVTHEDVTGCERRRLEYFDIPPDLDPDPYECAFYVNWDEDKD